MTGLLVSLSVLNALRTAPGRCSYGKIQSAGEILMFMSSLLGYGIVAIATLVNVR